MHENEAGLPRRGRSGPREVRLRVRAVAMEIAAVRHTVVASAEAHGIGSDGCEAIALAVSEACANVVMHAYRRAVAPGPLIVVAYCKDHEFVVVVADEGPGIAPQADSLGLGLGLGLIGRLAQRMEITNRMPVGAAVKMCFAAPGD